MHQRVHANDLTPDQWSSLFAVTSYEVVLEYTMTKSLWYKTLRERFTSFFRQFTDEEIEKGITELEIGVFENLKEDDEILMKDPVLIHQLVKQNK